MLIWTPFMPAAVTLNSTLSSLLAGATLLAATIAQASPAGVAGAAPVTPLMLQTPGYASQAFKRFSEGSARRVETSFSTLCLDDAREGPYSPTVVRSVTHGAMTGAADELGLKALLALTAETREFVLEAGAQQAQHLQYAQRAHGKAEAAQPVTELTDLYPRADSSAELRRLMTPARSGAATQGLPGAFKECGRPQAVAGVASDLRLALAQGKKADGRVQFTDSVGVRWQATLEGDTWEARADLMGTSLDKALGLFERWAQLRLNQGLAPRTYVVQTVKHEGATVFVRAWLTSDYADGSLEEAQLLFSAAQPLTWHWSLPDSLARP